MPPAAQRHIFDSRLNKLTCPFVHKPNDLLLYIANRVTEIRKIMVENKEKGWA